MASIASKTATSAQLLATAERIFAERGFAGMTVRAITKAAGVNVAAIHYHFGGGESLREKIIGQQLEPILQERLARLEAIDRKATGIEILVDAWLRPVFVQLGRSNLGMGPGSRLLGWMFQLAENELPPALQAGWRRCGEKFRGMLGKSLPKLGVEEIAWRFHFMEGALANGLRQTGLENAGAEMVAGRLVRFVRAGWLDGLDADGNSPENPQGTFSF